MISQVTRYGSTKREKTWWTERDARDAADRVLQELKPRKGPKGSCEKCDAAERRLARRGTHSEWDDHCRNGSCCHCCPNIGTCEKVCKHLGKEVEKAKAAARDKRAKEKEQKKKQDEPYLKPRIKLWKRFGEARKAAGLTWEEYAKKAHVTCFRREKKIADFEQGEKITMSSGGLPYCGGDGFDECRIKPLIAAADALNVSLDYLLCRTDDPQPLKPKGKTEKSDSDLSWRSPKDHPAEGLVVVLRFQFDNDRKTTLMGKWKDGAWCFLNGQKTAMQPSAWFPLPAFEKGETPHD